MKKILFAILMLIGLQASSQVILQNVVLNFDGKISVCADTLAHEDYTCQISQSIDSVEVSPEYVLFVDMCNELSGHVTTSFVCQVDWNQLFYLEPANRIIVRWNNSIDQDIYRYATLTNAQQKIYNDFIAKVKSKIIY
jgi:hypothetical protein